MIKWIREVYAHRKRRPSWTVVLQYFFFQRILRINGHVPWPVHWTSTVHSYKSIVLQPDSHSSPGGMPGQYIQALNGIRLGSNVWIGPGVALISANHDLADLKNHVLADPIIIEDDVWIGAHAVILPGVRLGKGVVVGAGAVVTHSVESGWVIGGVPARQIRRREPLDA